MNLYGERNFVAAEPYLRRVISSGLSRTEVAIALHLVGIIELRRRHREEALVLLDQSISLNDKLGNYHGLAVTLNSRGRVKRDLGDLDGALADLNRAAELDDESMLAMVMINRANVKRDLGDLDGALADLNRAAELDDERMLAMTLNTRASVKRDLGDIDGALRDIDKLRAMPS